MDEKRVIEQPLPELKTSLKVEISKIGEDYHILLTGGTKPHIGCTVLAVPRKSLSENGKISSTSSVINLPGHKDEEICRYLAEQFSVQKKAVVVCTGGFHMDHMTPEQIEQVIEAVKRITY